MRRGLFSALVACVVLVLPNGCVEYDSSNVGKKCAYNTECPEGYICDLITQRCKKGCAPDCDGKCCGSDGCGGACPDECRGGDYCDGDTCKCQEYAECERNDDCPPGYWCDRTMWRCRPIDCIPNCTGKCCGSDGCDGVCPDVCPAGYYCDPVSCQCVSRACRTDADCMAIECCLNGVCVTMSCGPLECGPDPVCGMECGPCREGYHCDRGECVTDIACQSDYDCTSLQCCHFGVCVGMACGSLECGPDPVCYRECGPCPAGYYCDNGNCLLDGVGLCPPGQECVQVGADGLLGCVIPPNSVPPDNQTGCSTDFCRGNFSCHCLDSSCSQSVCIENCGSCPTGMQCCRLWDDGPWGCLIGDCSDLPYNPPYCDQYNPCQGNANCFTDGTNNFCIEMCSVSGEPCEEGARVCQGDIVMQCEYGHWVERADCASSNRECIDGGCHTPTGLGEFCNDGACASGLDCLPDPAGGRAFCTQLCNCGTDSYCDYGWECRISNQPDNPSACWCAKMCPSRNPYVDCPNGGAGWECVFSGIDPEGVELYICMPD